MKIINKFFLYVYAFLAFYIPTFFNNSYLNYSIPFILLIIGMATVLFHKGQSLRYFFNKKNVILLFILIIVSSIYFAIRSLLAGTEFLELDKLRIVQNFMMLCSFVCIFIIILKLEQFGYNKEQKISFILNVALIQSFICILMLIFPILKETIVHQILLNGEGNVYTIAKRMYGITMDYTFATPVFHALLAIIALTYGLYKNKKYYLYIPFLLLAIILNGRTGLFVFCAGAVLVFMYYLVDTKKVVKVLSIITVFILIVLFVFGVLKIVKNDTYLFFIDGINDMLLFLFEGEKEGNINYLSTRWEEGIKNVNVIFGEGYRVYTDDVKPEYAKDNHFNTDIGYINDLYMGGIIYILLLYSSIVIFVCMGTKYEKDKKINRLIYFSLLLMIFICNIKGEIFRSTIVLNLVIYIKLVLCGAKFIRKERLN